MLSFKRKVLYNRGSLWINIPKEVAEALEISKGDIVEIIYANGSFTVKKKDE